MNSRAFGLNLGNERLLIRFLEKVLAAKAAEVGLIVFNAVLGLLSVSLLWTMLVITEFSRDDVCVMDCELEFSNWDLLFFIGDVLDGTNVELELVELN